MRTIKLFYLIHVFLLFLAVPLLGEVELDGVRMPIVRAESDLGVLVGRLGIDFQVVLGVASKEGANRDQGISLIFWVAGNVVSDAASSEKLSEILNWCLSKVGDEKFSTVLVKQSADIQRKVAEYLLFEWGESPKEKVSNLSKKYPKVAAIFK